MARETWRSRRRREHRGECKVTDQTNTNALKDYQQRVVDEHKDLVEKITKLSAFLGTEKFTTLSAEDQNILLRQYTVMISYRDVLALRISRFYTFDT